MVQIVLNEEEMDRICVLRQVKERQLTQTEAWQRLGLTSRQIRRLLKRVETQGSKGIKSQIFCENERYESSKNI